MRFLKWYVNGIRDLLFRAAASLERPIGPPADPPRLPDEKPRSFLEAQHDLRWALAALLRAVARGGVS